MKEFLKTTEGKVYAGALALGTTALTLAAIFSPRPYVMNDAKPAVVMEHVYTPAYDELISVKPPIVDHYPASWELNVQQCNKPVGEQGRKCNTEYIYVDQQSYGHYSDGATVIPQDISVPAPEASGGFGF